MTIANTKETEAEGIKNEKIVEAWWTQLERRAEAGWFRKKILEDKKIIENSRIMVKQIQILSFRIREVDLEDRGIYWTQDIWA